MAAMAGRGQHVRLTAGASDLDVHQPSPLSVHSDRSGLLDAAQGPLPQRTAGTWLLAVTANT